MNLSVFKNPPDAAYLLGINPLVTFLLLFCYFFVTFLGLKRWTN